MRRLIAGSTLAVGLSFGLVMPALAATPGVIHVPQDFDPARSDTRATGHYEVVGTGLRVWTVGSTSTDKVAEYVATSSSSTSTATAPPTASWSARASTATTDG